MVDLGNAIRSGDAAYVYEIIETNNGIESSALSRRGLQFEITLRKQTKAELLTSNGTEENSKTSLFYAQDSIQIYKEKFNMPDKMYVTPFHLAIIAQQAEVVYVMLEATLQFANSPAEAFKKLLEMKTKINFARGSPETYFKDDRTLDEINSFHLAARIHPQSLLIIVRFLRDKDMLEPVLPLLQVCDPHMGKTPFHMAAKSPSPLSLKILVALDDIEIDARDKRGYTALHIASKGGLEANCQLLVDHGVDVNAYGDDGHRKTPLHRARTKKIVSLLIKHGANPFARQGTQEKSVMDVLLQTHPQAVEEIMNAGIETNGQELDSSDLEIIFNFEIFFREGLREEIAHIEDLTNFNSVNEMLVMSKIVDSNYKDLLKNPLAEAFLHIKWQLIDTLFYMNVGFYATFLLMLTIMMVLLGNMSKCVDDPEHVLPLNCSQFNKKPNKNFWNVVKIYISEESTTNDRIEGYAFIVSFVLTVIGLIFLAVREFLQLITNFKNYVASFENYVEFLIVLLTGINIILLCFDKDWSIHAGAWAVFLGWCELALLLGRIPTIGIFIYLLYDVLGTLMIFLFIYSPVLIAFALIFHLLLPSQETYQDPLTSLLKVLAMMIGELEFGNFLIGETSVDFGAGSAQWAFFLFILIGNIVIANLLIGLTVSKTEDLFKKAGIVRLHKTVNQIVGIDRVFGETWQKMLFFTRRTKLFSYLNTLLVKNVKNGENRPSPWKICVMPHSNKQPNSKGRRVLNQVDASTLSFDKPYSVYLYDDKEDCTKEKLKFTIPSWVILHTLAMLEDKKLKDDAQKATEMEKDVTNMQTLEKLYEDMSQDSPEKRPTSTSPENNPDQKQSEKVAIEPFKRKVSMVPHLSLVSEEEDNSCNKDEKIELLEKKLYAMQSSLQELQELVTAIKRPETPNETSVL